MNVVLLTKDIKQQLLEEYQALLHRYAEPKKRRKLQKARVHQAKRLGIN